MKKRLSGHEFWPKKVGPGKKSSSINKEHKPQRDFAIPTVAS